MNAWKGKGGPSKDFIIVRIESDVVLVNVSIKFVGSKDFGNLHELVVVIVAVEKRLLSEDLLKR